MEPQIIHSNDAATSSKSLMLIAFVLAIAALYFGRQLFIPLALGLVFAFLLTPFVSQLEKLRIGRGPSVFVALILSLGVAGFAGWVVARQLVETVSELPDYKYNLELKIRSLHASKDGNLRKATATVQELNRELSSASGQIASAQDKATRHPIQVQVAAPPTNILQDLRTLLGPLAGILETAAIVTIFTVFMLLKREDLRNRAFRLAGRGRITVMTQALDDAGRRLSRYLLLQFLVNAGYGLLFGTGLYFVGIPHAFLWGVLAALLRFIPYLGVLAAVILPTLMALAVFPGWRQAGLTLGIFFVLEAAVANFVEPYVYGSNTGISSLAILVAAVFWTTLWGPVGLILSTPLTVCLIVLGRYVPQLNFLEIVLGDESALSPHQSFYQRLVSMDYDEARAVVEKHLQDKSLESVYEDIFLPALKLAEKDYHKNGLDADTRKFVLRSIREFIEDIGDRLAENSSDPALSEGTYGHVQDGVSRRAGIACMPAKSGSDELIALMLTQLLQQGGFKAHVLETSSIEDMLLESSRHGCNLICVSSLTSPHAGQSRSLCRRLGKSSGVQIIIGWWSLDGDSATAREKVGPECPFAVTTTFSDALKQMRQMTKSSESLLHHTES